MKPLLNNFSARFIRIFVTAVTILALIPSLYIFMYIMVLHVPGNDECLWVYQPSLKKYLINRVVKGGVADQAGIKNGDYLVKFNGKSFQHGEDAVKMLNNVPLNSYATYTIERAGIQFDTQILIIKVFDYTYFSVFLLGFGFLLFGYTVAMTKPVGVLQRRFWLYGLLSLLFFAVPNPPFFNSVDPINLIFKRSNKSDIQRHSRSMESARHSTRICCFFECSCIPLRPDIRSADVYSVLYPFPYRSPAEPTDIGHVSSLWVQSAGHYPLPPERI